MFARTLSLIHQRQAPERSFGTSRIEPYRSALTFAFAWPSARCRCLLLPYGLSDMSCPIFQALPNDALYGAFGVRHVVNAERNAVAVAKIELAEISVQMFFSAMLIHTFHAALEDRKEASTVLVVISPRAYSSRCGSRFRG